MSGADDDKCGLQINIQYDICPFCHKESDHPAITVTHACSKCLLRAVKHIAKSEDASEFLSDRYGYNEYCSYLTETCAVLCTKQVVYTQ